MYEPRFGRSGGLTVPLPVAKTLRSLAVAFNRPLYLAALSAMHIWIRHFTPALLMPLLLEEPTTLAIHP